MPAPFAAQLCGFRLNKQGELTKYPNTSDAGDKGSVELGAALLEELGVPEDRPGVDDPGAKLEEAIQGHLQPQRPDLVIRRSRSALEFEQYAHLRVFPAFKEGHINAGTTIEELRRIAAKLPPSAPAKKLLASLDLAATKFEEQDRISERLKLYMPEESLLKLDLTCATEEEGKESILRLGLSSKWTLRTDRAQDCVSQGSKLASQRRGPMPHYAVITMEPRPAMLKILADGSGSVDYVYHLDLPALTRAIEKVRARPRKGAKWSPGLTFDRLLNQGRIRDYNDLESAVLSLPKAVPSAVPEGAIAAAEEEAGRKGETVEEPAIRPLF